MDLLGAFGGSPSPVVHVPAVQIKYQGIPGFNTASFGQTWMGMSGPGAELKITMPTPASISMGGSLPEAYSQKLGSEIGIQKVEVINNEVIAAGQPIDNLQQAALVHCRVTPQNLEFTVRSVDETLTQNIIQDIRQSF